MRIVNFSLSLFIFIFIGCKSESSSLTEVSSSEIPNERFSFYCQKQKYSIGENVKVKVNSKRNSTFNLVSLLRGDTVLSIKTNPYRQITRNTDFFHGCNWQDSFEFTLPDTLSNGLYGLCGKDQAETECSFPLIVSEKYESDLLVVCSTNTWQAYNFWGGGSLYKLDSTWKAFGSVSNLVHFNRPNPTAVNSSHLVKGELHLHRWLKKHQIPFDLCSDADLSSGIDLSRYKTVVLNCHNEYWTDAMYDAIEQFTKRGGNLVSLGGNQMYARVTIKDGQMEFHEHGGKHIHDGSEGGLWRNLNKPESAILGVQYTMDLYDTYSSYQVLDGKHWVFDGLENPTGKQFGMHSDNRGWAAGHEMDVTTEFSPSSTHILAKGLNGLELEDGRWTSKPGGAEIVIGDYLNGGQFFSVGSITFSGALAHDTIASKMLLNVIKRFGAEK